MSTKKTVGTKRAISFAREFIDDAGREQAQRAADDPTTPPELRAELKRYLANPIQAAAEDMEQLLEDRAPLRDGGKPGRVTAETKYIRGLVEKFPAEAAEKLWRTWAGKDPIKTMKHRTFINQVSRARKYLSSAKS